MSLMSAAFGLLTGSKKKATPTAKPQTAFAPIKAPTQYSSDVMEAGRDVRRTASKRKGYMAAIRAGETGANQSYQSTSGVRSLMGVP